MYASKYVFPLTSIIKPSQKFLISKKAEFTERPAGCTTRLKAEADVVEGGVLLSDY